MCSGGCKTGHAQWKRESRWFCFLDNSWTAMLGFSHLGSESLMGLRGAQPWEGLQYMHCERVSFQGGIPRDVGNREAGMGSRKGRKKPRKLSNLPASHSDFSDSLKKENPSPKRQQAKPQIGQSTRNKGNAINSTDHGKTLNFSAASAVNSGQPGASPHPPLSALWYCAAERRPGALGHERLLTCH